jgi:hypothetical protein
MRLLRCTLVTDGSSDRALIPILQWLLREHGIQVDGTIEWFDPSLPRKRAQTLAEKLTQAVDFYPCDLLFVHRDAEAEPYAQRKKEIDDSWTAQFSQISLVRVIPVRMMEAWLLFDEQRIRLAAGCPNGKTPLGLPKLTTFEGLSDPKERLHQTLRVATEKSERQLKKFVVDVAIHRLAVLIDDDSPLRKLPAFQKLEGEIETAVRF